MRQRTAHKAHLYNAGTTPNTSHQSVSVLVAIALFVSALGMIGCSSTPEKPIVTVQVQYRVTRDYKPDSTASRAAQMTQPAPQTTAMARANIFEKRASKATASFVLNGQQLYDADRGTYLRNDANIVSDPYVLQWSVKDYQDSTVVVSDTILAPLAISDFSSGDTVSKAKGFTLQFTGVAGEGATMLDRVYGLIVGQNPDGTPLLTDNTRTMFDQADDGQLEVAPGVLAELRTNTSYKLLIERGRTKKIRQYNVDVVSSSFSEALTYFYLVE